MHLEEAVRPKECRPLDSWGVHHTCGRLAFLSSPCQKYNIDYYSPLLYQLAKGLNRTPQSRHTLPCSHRDKIEYEEPAVSGGWKLASSSNTKGPRRPCKSDSGYSGTISIVGKRFSNSTRKAGMWGNVDPRNYAFSHIRRSEWSWMRPASLSPVYR